MGDNDAIMTSLFNLGRLSLPEKAYLPRESNP
jgi:hypothetical protein